MMKMMLVAFLALASHSQIVRLGVIDCDNGGFNNGLKAIHNTIAPLYRNQPNNINLAVSPAPNCEGSPQPTPPPVHIPPVQTHPKRCDCKQHHSSNPIQPVRQNPIKSHTHEREGEESSLSSNEESRQSKACKNCGGEDCKCAAHNPPHKSHDRPHLRPLLKKNGQTCDRCKDGKCECSDCKCANCRTEQSNDRQTNEIKQIQVNLSQGQ